VSVELENVAKQSFTGFNTETPTPGYSLVNLAQTLIFQQKKQHHS
jgi:hypothetical protein